MIMSVRKFVGRLCAIVLSALDEGAGRWLDWRMDRAVAANPELEQFKLRKAHWENGRWQTEGFSYSPAVVILAEGCAQMLTAANATNYIEFEMLPRLDRGLRPVAVTVRWLNGELPSTKAARLEAELAKINDALAQCGIAGIMDEFHHPADAISQMAGYIREMEPTWRQLGEPEDYADHADVVFEVGP